MGSDKKIDQDQGKRQEREKQPFRESVREDRERRTPSDSDRKQRDPNTNSTGPKIDQSKKR